jgi:chromosome partitioning protein
MYCGKMGSFSKTIAFHSYKGGSGKTTLITNIAALYAMNGLNVGLIDYDLYAPSLVSYFRKKPDKYINDLLSGESQIKDVMVDLSSELGLKGRFLVGFSSARKEDINEIEVKHEWKWQAQALKRFLNGKNELFEKEKLDFLFLDTSPGIRYWSINTLAMADMLFLLMKDSDVDVEGTRKMISEIYDELSRFGSKYYVVLNKVPGALPGSSVGDEHAWRSELERVVGAEVVGSIPCYCDIQFSRHEYLFSVNRPEHPFSIKLSALAETIKSLSAQ